MKSITHNDYTQRINKVAEYINHHLDEPIELKTLADIAHLSHFHFCRIFKVLKGESPIAFIARLRIETAAQLLRYSTLPIEQIAFNIGYETPASLSKAFKNQYGITPTEYRTNKDIYIMKKEIINPDLALKAPKIMELEPKNLIYVALMGKYSSLDYGKAYEQLWTVVKSQKLFTKGIESMSYLIEIICHTRDCADELHIFGFDACLDFCFCNEPSQKLGASDGCLARFTQQGVVLHCVEPKKHLVFSFL